MLQKLYEPYYERAVMWMLQFICNGDYFGFCNVVLLEGNVALTQISGCTLSSLRCAIEMSFYLITEVSPEAHVCGSLKLNRKRRLIGWFESAAFEKLQEGENGDEYERRNESKLRGTEARKKREESEHSSRRSLPVSVSRYFVQFCCGKIDRMGSVFALRRGGGPLVHEDPNI